MVDNVSEVQNYDDHKETYDNFISGCIATVLVCFFILTCLVICGLAHTHWITNLIVGMGWDVLWNGRDRGRSKGGIELPDIAHFVDCILDYCSIHDHLIERICVLTGRGCDT